MARPHVDQDLASKVRRLHRGEQGEEPGSFQEALDTVVQLAHQQQSQNQNDGGWYPGKYAQRVVSAVADNQPDSSSSGEQTRTVSTTTPTASLPDETLENRLVFKSRIDSDGTITVPEIERAAVDADPSTVFQVIAYPIDSTTDTDD